MPAQKFQSIFTADISQYRSEMQVLKQSTSGVVGEIRNSFAAIAGLSIAGIGVKELVSDIIKLGAEMQQTRTAFEVMLGSASAADKVIGELNRFADYTPFDNDEVIKSGRLLMNAGVATDQLSAKLTTLGNISAGAQVPLTDMVAIYAKAANKGKVQAEELNQMSERGVPVMQALAETLGRTTQEILDMGSKGQLSFALLDEALASLSNEGGKYFGLMEKQSQNLAGRWSTVTAAIRNTGIAIGEEAIPALSAALEEFSAALDEMSQSGELDTIVRDTALALGEIAQNLKDITLWMIKHQAAIKSIAGGALWIGVAMKSRAIIMSLAGGLTQLAAAHTAQAAAAAASAAATGAVGTAAAAASVKVGLLSTALKGVGVAAGVAGAVLATAFIGFKIGSVLGELLKLDEVFTRLILKKQGLTDAEIDSAGANETPTATVPKYDLAKAEKEKAGLEARLAKLSEIKLPKETDEELSLSTPALEAELAKVNDTIAQAQAGSDKRLEELAATDDKIRELLNEREALEKRLAGRHTAAEREKITGKIAEIDTRTGDYQQKAEAEIAAIEETEKKVGEAFRKLQDLRARQEEAEKNRPAVQTGTYNNAQVPGLDENYQQPQYGEDYKGEIEDASRQLENLRKLLYDQKKTRDEYEAAKKEFQDYKASAQVDKAEKLSAAEKFRAEEQKRLQEEVSSHLAKLTKSDTELKRAEWAKQVASYREAYKKAGLESPEQSARLDDLEAAGYAAIDEERKKKQQSLYDQLAKLTLSETALKKRELAKQLEEYRKAGATQQQLARLQSASLAQIERDKNQKILTAQKQLISAQRNQAEDLANNRLDAMMRKLDQAGVKLRKSLDKFAFNPEDDWKKLAKSPRERRERKKNVELDQQIDEKMAAVGRGDRVRFTRPERERIKERERIEKRLAENEKKGLKEQRAIDNQRKAEREQELAQAVKDARKNLDDLRDKPVTPRGHRQPIRPPAQPQEKPPQQRPQPQPQQQPQPERPVEVTPPEPQQIAVPVEVTPPAAQTVSVPVEVTPPAPQQIAVPVEVTPPAAQTVSVPVEVTPPAPQQIAVPVEVTPPAAQTVSVPVEVTPPAPQQIAVPVEVTPPAAQTVSVPVEVTPPAPQQIAVPVEVTPPAAQTVSVPVEVTPPAPQQIAVPVEVTPPAAQTVSVPVEVTPPAPQQIAVPVEVTPPAAQTVSVPVEVTPPAPQQIAVPVEVTPPAAQTVSVPVEVTPPAPQQIAVPVEVTPPAAQTVSVPVEVTPPAPQQIAVPVEVTPPAAQTVSVPVEVTPPAPQQIAVPVEVTPPAAQTVSVPVEVTPPAPQQIAVPVEVTPPAAQTVSVPVEVTPPAPQQIAVPVEVTPPAAQTVSVPVDVVPPAPQQVAVPVDVVPPEAQTVSVPVEVTPPAPQQIAVPVDVVPPEAQTVSVPVEVTPPAPQQIAVPVEVPPEAQTVSVPVEVTPPAPQQIAVPVEVTPPAPQTVPVPRERPWISELRPSIKTGDKNRPNAINAVEGSFNYSGHLDQILQQMKQLNKRFFVVKGA